MQHIIIALEAPMMSFGTAVTDTLGPTGAFPGLSALTGLLANAMGWTRTQPDLLQALHDHLIMGSRIDRASLPDLPQTDFQTAQLSPEDSAWTSRGEPETRAGGRNTLIHPVLRFRQYIADGRITTAFRVHPAPGLPSHDDLVQALLYPARPLFIGRKPFIPSVQLFQETRDADDILQALMDTPLSPMDSFPDPIRLSWPHGEGSSLAAGVVITDQYHTWDRRSWHTRLHTGSRPILEGTAPRTAFPPADPYPSPRTGVQPS